jgi:3-deoxy-manno-octulosonate cytidylyltransferase (CMP-KDO synthetase)
MHELAIIVPGRLASTRFPEKLLFPVLGTPLILHTARRIRSEVPELPLYFAVDHPRLAAVLEGDGFQAVLTREDHPSGTDRLAEANGKVGTAFVVNVQADEPMVTRAQILQLADLVRRDDADMATLAHRFNRAEDFLNPNQVKVVMGVDGRALYFSRASIPFRRDGAGQVDDAWLEATPCYRHLGLYAYTRAFLEGFHALPPSFLEETEKLEQLRALQAGCRILVGVTHGQSVGVDTPADAARFEAILSPVAKG